MPKIEITRKNNKFYMDGSFYARRSVEHKSHEHTHDFVEIVYVIKGKSTHTVDGKQYLLGAGDMLLINYHCVHSFESVAGFEYADILIKPEFICEGLGRSENAFSLLNAKDFEVFADTVGTENCRVTFTGKEKHLIEDAIDVMCDELPTVNLGAELLSRSALNILLFAPMGYDTLRERFFYSLRIALKSNRFFCGPARGRRTERPRGFLFMRWAFPVF